LTPLFELQIDGFRALAHIQDGSGELVSRNGNTFGGFAELADWIAAHLKIESAVIDGEIACIDEAGRHISSETSSGDQRKKSGRRTVRQDCAH
jgi:ATP-dependent DNA ligase